MVQQTPPPYVSDEIEGEGGGLLSVYLLMAFYEFPCLLGKKYESESKEKDMPSKGVPFLKLTAY